MKIITRGILSYFHVDFSKFECNNYDFVEFFILLFENFIVAANAKIRRAAGATPDANGHADKNGLSRSAARRKRKLADIEIRCAAEDGLMIFLGECTVLPCFR
jgi:hypothetical protein